MKKAHAIAAILALCLSQALIHAQQPEPIADNLLRLEGTDPDYGIHYVKLILLLKSPDNSANSATASPGDLPRFTMECRDHAGKRSLHWLVRFNGNSDF